MQYIWAYAGAAVFFFVVDMLWLGFIARGLYYGKMGALLRENPDVLVAGVFYAFYVMGIVYFAIAPGLEASSLNKTLINGALIGLFAYGTYDATNLATLKGYSPLVAIVDTVWGTMLTASAAGAGYLTATKLTGSI